MKEFFEKTLGFTGTMLTIAVVVCGILVFLAIVFTIINSIKSAIGNLEKTLMSVDRVHNVAKLQLVTSLVLTFFMMYTLNSAYFWAFLGCQVSARSLFDRFINAYKNDYIPHRQHPMPVVEVENQDDCFEIDLEGVINSKMSSR